MVQNQRRQHKDDAIAQLSLGNIMKGHLKLGKKSSVTLNGVYKE